MARNLQPITPPLRDGQRVQCAGCGRMTAAALADLSAAAGTFYCPACAPAHPGPWRHWGTGTVLDAAGCPIFTLEHVHDGTDVDALAARIVEAVNEREIAARPAKVGERCAVLQDDGSTLTGKVERRGRSAEGIYFEVRYDNGTTERMHPDYCRLLTASMALVTDENMRLRADLAACVEALEACTKALEHHDLEAEYPWHAAQIADARALLARLGR